MVEKKAFLMKPKRQCHLSQWGECVYRAQSWKEKRLLWEHKFIPIDEQTFIIRKIIERKPFLIRPKHQCHLSQEGEWVYSAQPYKEKRLLCESVFIPIDRWTLILKNGRNGSFFYETKD